MTVDDIKADEVVEMTDLMHRAFVAAGCVPECHGCGKDLPHGTRFKLATVHQRKTSSGMRTTHEVMLCADCTVADVEEPAPPPPKPGGGCFRVNGRLVTSLKEGDAVIVKKADDNA